MSQTVTEQIAEEYISLSVKTEDVYSQGGSLFFVAKALVEAFVPVEVMEQYAWTGKGKEARWRHELPEDDVNVLIGHMHDCWFEDGGVKAFVEIWGYKESLKEKQAKIESGEFSVSLGFKKTYDEANENIVGIYIREISLTPTPQCTLELGCSIESIIALEETDEVENTMPDNNEMIELLQKTVISENTTLKALSNERLEQITTLEATVSAMEERIVSSNSIISEQGEKITTLEKQVDEAESKLGQSVTTGIRNEIIALLEITDEKAKEAEFEELSQLSIEQLKREKKRIERITTLTQKKAKKTLGQQPIFSSDLENSEEEISELDKLTPEQLAAKVNPEFAQYLKKRNATPAGFDVKDGNVPMID